MEVWKTTTSNRSESERFLLVGGLLFGHLSLDFECVVMIHGDSLQTLGCELHTSENHADSRQMDVRNLNVFGVSFVLRYTLEEHVCKHVRVLMLSCELHRSESHADFR